MSDLDNQIIAFKDSMAKSVKYAIGDENTDVQTPNGLIPSIAKQAKQNRDKLATILPDLSNRLRTDVIDLSLTAEMKANARANVGLELANNTADEQKPVSKPQQAALDALTIKVDAKEVPTNKNSENGYVGIVAWKLVVRNLANTFTNFLSASTTAARSWVLPDKSGTIALTSDITGTNSGINTGDETQATILYKLGSTNLSGDNTGDETKDSILAKIGYTPVAPEDVTQSVLYRYVAGLPGTVNANDTITSAIVKLQTQLGGVTAVSGQAEVVANKTTNFSIIDDVRYPTTKAVKTYVESRIVGILSDRGSFSAANNQYPAANGSGDGGAILKGNLWFVNAPGTLGGVVVNVGDSVRALVDNPGQTATNWSVLESNLGYVPYNASNPLNFTSNQTDSFLLSRSNHTGSQSADTISETSAKSFVTPAQKAAIEHSNRSALDLVTGSNSGDETAISIRSKLGISTLSGANTGDQSLASLGAEDKTKKDASGGYAGLTGFSINLKDITGTVVSYLRNANTAIRTYTFPDKSGTVALMDDVNAMVSGGAETQASILTKLGASRLTGSNTGDQTINLTGDVTGQGGGTFSTLIADRAVNFVKMLAIPTNMFLGRVSAGPGSIEVLSAAQMKAMLDLDQIDNTLDSNKPVSAAQANAIALKESSANKTADFNNANDTKFPTTLAVKTLTDAMKAGMVFDCGNYNPHANSNGFPTAGGTGESGIVKRGNVWRITTSSVVAGKELRPGSTVRALVDAPGQELANWLVTDAPWYFTPLNSSKGVMSGPLTFAVGGIIASAQNINLGATNGNIAEVSGNTTILAMTAPPGTVQILRFNDTLSLVHSNEYLRLPGSKTITTAKGDQGIFVSRANGGANFVECISYTRASGAPVLPFGQDTVRAVNANSNYTEINLNTGDGATTFKVTVSVNSALAFVNPPPAPFGEIFSFTLITINDETPGRALAFSNAIQWAGGQLPPRTTSANAVDVWTFYVDNGVYTGSLSIADRK